MFTGKIKIKAKFYVKIKAVMEIPVEENLTEAVNYSDYLFDEMFSVLFPNQTKISVTDGG